MVVLDNQVATLQVGDQVPIATGSATLLTPSNTVVNTIDYRNTGIILRVVPRINVNGNVLLDIEQEISNVAASNADGSTLTPTVSQRKVKSSIAVASGQTVLLAGLISERQERDGQGIPLLDQIPGLGDAFSHTTQERAAHRADHLHPAADHSRQRRCPFRRGRIARKVPRPANGSWTRLGPAPTLAPGLK